MGGGSSSGEESESEQESSSSSSDESGKKKFSRFGKRRKRFWYFPQKSAISPSVGSRRNRILLNVRPDTYTIFVLYVDTPLFLELLSFLL